MNIRMLVAFVLILASFGMPMQAEVATREMEVPVVKLARLFVQADYRSDGTGDTVRRVRPLFYVGGDSRCRAKVELNLAATEAVNGGNGNWLEIGALECRVNDQTTISVGRLFLSAPYSTPPPFLLRTVEYPSANRFNAYGYGVQISRSFGEWALIADITGNSGKEFNADGNFDRFENSIRITRKLSVGSVGVTGQFSEEFSRVGLDWFSASSEKLGLWLGVYYNNDTDHPISAMGQVSYPVGKYLRPHVMYDLRADGRDVVTVGSEIFLNGYIRLIADYELGEEGRLLARVQYKF